MSAKCVPVLKTECSEETRIKGFISGWKKLLGDFPSKESVGVLLSQNNVETGGSTHMYNWNVGNVKYMPAKTNDPDADSDIEYMMLSHVWEIINKQKVYFEPPHPATWFRSFPTLEDGFAFHLNFLKNKKSYKAAWAAVVAGNPVAFSKSLKAAMYYTAPEADYTKLIKFHFDKFMKNQNFEKMLLEVKNEQKETALSKVSELFFKKD
jgi:hypothetical protein